MAAPPHAALTLQSIRDALAIHRPEKHPTLGRASAVLVPLFERDGRTHVVLTKRTEGLSSHAGQVSFPGGKPDPADADLRITALREAHEEIGLARDHVETIGELDDCPTFVTRYVITPIVGIIPDPYVFTPNEDEIATLFDVPLEAFLQPGVLRTQLKFRDDQRYHLYFYSVAGHTVWGATARILTQLLQLGGASPSGEES